MNIYCNLQIILDIISKKYNLNKIHYKINNNRNLGDISINILNEDTRQIIKNEIFDLNFISDIKNDGNYINLYIDDLTWLNNIIYIFQFNAEEITYNFEISHPETDNYNIKNLVSHIYNINYQSLNKNNNAKKIIISSSIRVKDPNYIYRFYNMFHNSKFDSDLFAWSFFSVKNNRIADTDFTKLNQLSYQNKLFKVFYTYSRANYFIERITTDSEVLSDKELKLIKWMIYLPISKQRSIYELDLYYINEYICRIADLFLEITYNLSNYKHIIALKIMEIIEWGLSRYNIKPQKYL